MTITARPALYYTIADVYFDRQPKTLTEWMTAAADDCNGEEIMQYLLSLSQRQFNFLISRLSFARAKSMHEARGRFFELFANCDESLNYQNVIDLVAAQMTQPEVTK